MTGRSGGMRQILESGSELSNMLTEIEEIHIMRIDVA